MHINRNANIFSWQEVSMFLASSLKATPLNCGAFQSICSDNEFDVSEIWFVIDLFAVAVALYLNQPVQDCDIFFSWHFSPTKCVVQHRFDVQQS